MEQKAGEPNNEDLLSSSGITSNGGSSSPFFMSSVRGTIIENTSSAGTLAQIPFFPKYEVELDSPRKVIPYPGKEHIERVLEEYSHQVKDLQRRLNEVEDQLEALKSESQNKIELLLQQHQDRIEQLISEHEIEITGLTEKASSARSQANSIQSQLEIIQEQARNQNSMYMRQLSDLESTVSQLRSELREAKRMYEDKIEELEKQLVLANSELTEARTERDQFSQESGNLDDQLQKLLADLHKREKELSLEKEQNKRLWDRDTGNSITIDHLRRELDDRNMEVQRLEALLKAMKSECQGQMERQMAAIQGKNESLEKVSSLTAQLESTKEMLRKVVEELTAKKMTLESSERTISDLTSSLQEKERAIEATNSEITKLRSRVDLKLQELQHLKTEGDHLRNVQTECEALRLQMAEKDKVIEILRQQIENMTQLVGQHGRTAGAMQVEKAQLEKEINDRRLELQEFKILKDKKDAKIRELEARVSDLELEKVKLVNAGSERLRAVKDIKQERDQLLNEVKTSRSELNGLTEDYEVLKRNFRNKTEEMEATTNKLKMQLKSAQSELEQTRNTLKSMEGSDGHAMKVAMGMQKQITAKRGQIDALQSKIQFLEEAMTNANKEKHFLKEEKTKLSQELSTVATEKNKMAGELEVLRSQERRLKEKVANMEVALDKASLQFAECQDIIQRQEQESVRLKLQHTLDVKELQGPGYTSNTSVKPRLLQPSSAAHSHSNVPSSQSTASFLSHHSMKPNTLKEDPTRDLKQLLQELRSVINEEPAVPLGKPEEEGRAPSLGVSYVAVSNNSLRDSTEGSKSSDTLSREPVTLHTGDLEDPSSCFTFPSTASPSVKNSASRSFHSSPKKSPVHSLLTSSVEDSVGSTSQYRSTKPVHSSASVKVSANRNNRKNMQKASEQTGKLANSGRRFTDEEPSNVFNDQESRKEDTESERPGKNVTKMIHCLPILNRGMMPN
ncbi:coiled-coil domain-containing protein 158 isoform X6 [Canis lupus familiaris]|uniref:coiled-coil domain-containing protein 158 isoform X6 n=1 Tax=Canis lupus familiaris TaxID=9615 RepID=UPI000BAA0F63|nr:coiled-coil domain-containing protein 158 isoform X6 [Canis lupus familiaris]XP_038318108.1 coiled-coil domain-containing protein 158 isoform X6 [Canis lupus familiaris]XP_038318109.1 coiled-coil domain-containing protein 158 isoform X6 [Canis lupus familiaris]XP_038318110.1 coiled-coil domain-containing protein 158 isoform X6 [Canis lupus familiaris]XP_038318111.1 coiled-coil domain-containing protein 158 isoform X6 [Canis lupus familiaris]XP_038318112.1 coiled-coil domain-containing prote|eukprot:XP_022269171.1 coiled-coil domain-containing protein 158 isoform X6 [Canis lupus familiaris]